jgi:hypothetical protein
MIEGHFLQMGGVLFYNNESRAKLDLRWVLAFDPLGDAVVEQEWTNKGIHRELSRLHSTMGPEEIQNQSKSDALSKTIVLVQTTWFTFQCIARAVQGLALTELENVTLAYTALNGVMCFFWWQKPLDVQCPVVFVLKNGCIDRQAVALFAKKSDSNGTERREPEEQERGKWSTRSILRAPLKGQFRYLIESNQYDLLWNKKELGISSSLRLC